MMYVVIGSISNEILTYHGHVLVHDNKEDLEWLIPGHRVVRLPQADIGRSMMYWKDHPDLAAVKWPLDKRDFR